MLLELGIAVGGGLLNALSGSAANSAAELEARRQQELIEKRKQSALALLKENIIDPDELDTMLDNVNRLFNNRLVNTLNSTALRSRGIANNTAVKGVVASGIESQRLGSINEAYNRMLENNKQVGLQAANVVASTPIIPIPQQSNFFGDFVGGALAAAPVGIELSKLFAGGNTDLPKPPGGGGSDDYNPNTNAKNMNNPFLNAFKIEDEDIFNFSKFF